MEELKKFNARDLFSKLFSTDEIFEKWLVELGLIHKERKCEICGGDMSKSQRKKRNYPTWRCTVHTCRHETGFLVGTFFEGMHLTLKDAFQISYYWCRQTHTRDEILFDMQRENETISRTTVTDWNNFYREICVDYYIRNPIKIGGSGTIVEIDETILTKKKI